MTKSPARKSASFTYMGQRYYVKGKDEADCKEKIALKLAELENKEKALVNPTVADWAQTWLDTYVKPKVRKPGTAKRRNTMTEKSYSMYERMINNIIIPAIGRKKLEAVTDTHLRNILNREATKSFSHVSKLRIVIKAMFSQAVASRVIIFDPSLKLELPAAEKGRRRALTAAEREAFDIVVERNKHGLWAKFLIGTGVRPNECSALTVADLDLTKRVLTVRDSVESGTKALGGGPKSHAGLRQIPIPLDLADELKKAVAEKSSTDFLFTQRDGKTMVTETCIRRWWENLKRDMDIALGAEYTAKGHIYDPSDLLPDGTPMYPDPDNPTQPRNGHRIADDLVLYDLRHTYCTDLKKAGVKLRDAQRYMGHSDMALTANIYTDVDEDDLLSDSELIDAFRKNKKSPDVDKNVDKIISSLGNHWREAVIDS